MSNVTSRGRGFDEGFTLIELLIVVFIVGVLAGISVPIFLGQQAKARDAAAIHDLSTAKTALVAWAVDHGGAFTTSLPDLVDQGYAASSIVDGTEIVINLSGDGFCIQANSSTGTTFNVTDSTAPVEGACS
jgi:type IV pilus assembly protein PilA